MEELSIEHDNSDLQATIDSLNSQIASLNSQISTLQTENALLLQMKTMLEGQVEDLESQVAELETILESGEITICHNGKTKIVSVASWGTHLNHGDTMGACS